ncbi:MAG: anti-sigma factor [Ferruginibacter sp.]|nr:anti-sigma factor [Ferruginibacter sp.]
METQDIISSGLLELYAAGIASEKESLDVQQWVAQYPEVAAELKEITSSMETYANAHAITPSAGVKEKIFSRINTAENGRIIPINSLPVPGVKVINTNASWKMAAAASVALLIGSIALNIITYNKYNDADRDLLVARQTVTSLEEKNAIMEAGMSVVQNKYSVPVSLKGLEASPDAAAKIFWMQNTGEVFIDPSNLPETPAGKQYQLWGIVDGKPVDGGMILTSKKGDKFRIQKMKTFGKVEAFAVTLETEKGNPSPQGPMFVMGKM